MRTARICLFALCFLSALCITVPAGACTFRRGDANFDGAVDISDGVRILNVLFLGAPKPDCDDVMDVNDEGAVDISDGIFLLGFLFIGTKTPPPPFTACGPDPTSDLLSCNLYHSCAPCLSEAGFQSAINGAAGDVCIPTGTAPIVVGAAKVTVVPAARAQPCGDPPSPGWPVQLTATQASLDIAGRSARVHIRGTVVDMPATVQVLFTSTNCSVDITFEGDAVFGLEFVPSGDKLVFTSIKSLDIQNPVVDLTASGGLACDLGQLFVDAVKAMLLTQIEGLIAQQVPALSEGLGCRVVCQNP